MKHEHSSSLGTDGQSVEKHPKVCIVVRTYHAGDVLRDVLAAVSDLDYPKEKLRLIIAASTGDDDARGCFDLFNAPQSGLAAELLAIETNSADCGRNEGIRASDTEFVLVIDDDVILDRLALARLMELVQSDQSTAAVSSPVIDDAPTLTGRLHFGRYVGRVANTYTVMPCTLFRKSLVTKCGLYREDMGPPLSIHEDWELGSRLRKNGFRVAVDGRVISRHVSRMAGQDLPAASRSAGNFQKRTGSRARTYISEYLHRNWWSMLQVLKVSPLPQKLEYIVYALLPVLLLLLLALDFEVGLLSVVAAIVAVSSYSIARGNYVSFGIKRRISYPLVLTSVRVLRTYLLVLGVIANSRHLDKRP